MSEPLMKVEVVSGVEGPALYFDDHRVDGPKPWGGGRIVHSFTVLVNDMRIVAEARQQGADAERARLLVLVAEWERAWFASVPDYAKDDLRERLADPEPR